MGVSEGKKWLDMFEDVCAVIFCVSLSDYDEFWPDNNGVLQNKLVQSKELFESILLHPCFRDTPFVLLLNKRDVFEEKICKGIPLSRCEWLSDFDPLKSVNSTPQGVAHQAYHYVVHKFKEVYTYVNNAKGTSGYKILTFELNARDRSKVNQAFMYIKDVLKWEEDKSSDCFHDSFSTDTTSSFYPSLSANHPAFYDYNNVGAYPGSAGWYVYCASSSATLTYMAARIADQCGCCAGLEEPFDIHLRLCAQRIPHFPFLVRKLFWWLGSIDIHRRTYYPCWLSLPWLRSWSFMERRYEKSGSEKTTVVVAECPDTTQAKVLAALTCWMLRGFVQPRLRFLRQVCVDAVDTSQFYLVREFVPIS